MNEVGQNSGANMADPIVIPDFNDMKEQERIKKNQQNNRYTKRLNESLSSLKNV